MKKKVLGKNCIAKEYVSWYNGITFELGEADETLYCKWQQGFQSNRT